MRGVVLSLFCLFISAAVISAENSESPAVAVCSWAGAPLKPSPDSTLLANLVCSALSGKGIKPVPPAEISGVFEKSAGDKPPKIWPNDREIRKFIRKRFPSCRAVLRLDVTGVRMDKKKAGDDPLLPLLECEVSFSWRCSLYDQQKGKMFDIRSGTERATGVFDSEKGKAELADLRAALVTECALRAAGRIAAVVEALFAQPFVLVVNSVEGRTITARPLGRSKTPPVGLEMIIRIPPAGDAAPTSGKSVGKAVVVVAKNGAVQLKILEGEAKKGYLLTEGRE